jgi:hypothetical protein
VNKLNTPININPAVSREVKLINVFLSPSITSEGPLLILNLPSRNLLS